jgi:uncharacterized protein (UPF0548 family)
MTLTYAEVGATRDPDLMPPSAHHLTIRESIGPETVFTAAADVVLTYGMQRGAGFAVVATTPRAEQGTELKLRAWFGPIRMTAPTRVVYVVDKPDSRGFAYGTLPGHPESGEELFLVERVDGQTWVEVRAFSRPGRWYIGLAGPIVRPLQRRAAARYIDAVRRAVAEPDMRM